MSRRGPNLVFWALRTRHSRWTLTAASRRHVASDTPRDRFIVKRRRWFGCRTCIGGGRRGRACARRASESTRSCTTKSHKHTTTGIRTLGKHNGRSHGLSDRTTSRWASLTRPSHRRGQRSNTLRAPFTARKRRCCGYRTCLEGGRRERGCAGLPRRCMRSYTTTSLASTTTGIP